MGVTLNAKQVASILKRTGTTVRKMAANGQIPSAKNVGLKPTRAYWVFDEKEIKRWVRENPHVVNGYKQRMRRLNPSIALEPIVAEAPQARMHTTPSLGTGMVSTMNEILERVAGLEAKIDVLLKVWS